MALCRFCCCDDYVVSGQHHRGTEAMIKGDELHRSACDAMSSNGEFELQCCLMMNASISRANRVITTADIAMHSSSSFL